MSVLNMAHVEAQFPLLTGNSYYSLKTPQIVRGTLTNGNIAEEESGRPVS